MSTIYNSSIIPNITLNINGKIYIDNSNLTGLPSIGTYGAFNGGDKLILWAGSTGNYPIHLV